ncbi:hypothetical protein Tco_0708751 [Tanacetum coccineum]
MMLTGDYTIAIIPVLSTKEAVDSLIMEDEHLDTIPATESDEVIKSSVENLVPIPSEFKGISEDTCDVPVCEDPSTFDALSNHSEILSDSNNDGTSSDDDSYENIEYIEASPLNLEIVSLEEVNEDQEEEEFDLEDIFQIQDVILREKLLNISRLVTNIESLKDNPTPDRVLKFSSSFPIPIVDSDSFFEESDTSFSYSNNSLPEFETFSDHTEETRSGSTTTHANNFFLMMNNFDNEDECFDPGGDEINIGDDDSFTFVIRTFLPYLTYPERVLKPKVRGGPDTSLCGGFVKSLVTYRKVGCAETKVASWDDLAFKTPLFLGGTEDSTDIAKISRKRSKPDKHGHGNGIECAKAGRMLSKVNSSQPKSTI